MESHPLADVGSYPVGTVVSSSLWEKEIHFVWRTLNCWPISLSPCLFKEKRWCLYLLSTFYPSPNSQTFSTRKMVRRTFTQELFWCLHSSPPPSPFSLTHPLLTLVLRKYTGDKDWCAVLAVNKPGAFDYQLVWTDDEGNQHKGNPSPFVFHLHPSPFALHLSPFTLILTCLF